MGYFFQTKNTMYTVRDTMNPNCAVLSGGKFDNNEIYKPQGLVGEGQPFVAKFTDNVANGDLRGRTVRTGSVMSIHAIRETDQDRMQTQNALNQKEAQARHNMRVMQAERLCQQTPESNQYQYQ